MSVPSIFLSYSSQDHKLACEIYKGLKKRRIKVWKAPEDIPPGGDWAAAIHQALSEQQIFLLLWTDSSMISDEVTKEITIASRNHMKMIPLKLTESEPISAQAYHLSATQWLEGIGKDSQRLLDLIEERVREQEINQDVLTAGAQSLAKGKVALKRTFFTLAWLVGLTSFAFDLNPWMGLNQGLLNQRLFWQARWRQLTQQAGPSMQPIALLPLTEMIYKELEIKPTDGSVNQAVLAKALALLPVVESQQIGLDFILDTEGANPEGHKQLANEIKKQIQERKVFAGLCPPNSEATKDCLKARNQRLPQVLVKAGTVPVSLGLGVSTKSQPPLQLSSGISKGSLASSIVGNANKRTLPGEAVIDWSLNWLSSERIRLLESRRDLISFQGDTLLISSDGYKGADLLTAADQHPAPLALKTYEGNGPERFSTLQEKKIPGGVLQAVLAQSISSGHWLRPLAPFYQTLSAALAAAVALKARNEGNNRRRVLFFLAGSLIYSLLVFQLAISFKLLVPIALPIAISALILATNKERGMK